MTEYKHINYNPLLLEMNWVLKQVDSSWKLCEVITYSTYEYVAVFEREKEIISGFDTTIKGEKYE